MSVYTHLFTVTFDMESGPLVFPGITALDEDAAVARACILAAARDYQPSSLKGVRVQDEEVSSQLH